jgi:two-component system, sensor histidine kinase YesM
MMPSISARYLKSTPVKRLRSSSKGDEIMLLWRFVNGFNNLKIKNKLVLMLVILIIVPLGIMGFVTFRIASKAVQEKVDYNLRSSVRQIGYNLDVILANMRSMVAGVYQDRLTQKFLSSGGTIYTRQQYEDFIMTKISRDNAATYLFTWDSRLYGYNISYTEENINYKNTMEYRLCRESNDKLVWMPTNKISIGSKIFPDDTRDRFGIAMIMKDFDSMREAGFVEMTFKESDIFNVYNKIQMSENSYGFVIDQQGIVVSHKDKYLLGKMLPTFSYLTDLKDKEGGGSFITRISGKDSLVVYETLTTTGWKLVYIVPTKDLTKDIILIKNIFLIIISICSVIAILIALFISRSISNPIEHIISLMTKFADGDMSVRIRKYHSRNDEVGVLATEFNSMIIQINSLIKNNYDNEIRKKEAEIAALQAQINPHFLYNTLDCIHFIARKYKVEEISRMVLALGDLMRISIRKDKSIITVKEEINYIENYMTIQKIRYKDKLSLQIHVQEELYDCMIPKLILQPIVENAVVHGIEEKVGNGTVILNAYRQDTDAVFEIIDDGVGFNEDVVQEMLDKNLREYEGVDMGGQREYISGSRNRGSSIGMLNVDMRLKIIYGGEYGVSIQSRRKEGTKVTIRLPFRTIE